MISPRIWIAAGVGIYAVVVWALLSLCRAAHRPGGDGSRPPDDFAGCRRRTRRKR